MFGIGDAVQIGKIFDSILDKFVADKTERDKLKADFSLALLAFQQQVAMKSAENVKAEIEGRPFQRNWRPLLMYVIIAIIACDFLLFPLIELTPWVPKGMLALDLPQNLYDLMEIGVGGYIISKSAERISHNVKGVFEKQKNGSE